MHQRTYARGRTRTYTRMHVRTHVRGCFFAGSSLRSLRTQAHACGDGRRRAHPHTCALACPYVKDLPTCDCACGRVTAFRLSRKAAPSPRLRLLRPSRWLACPRAPLWRALLARSGASQASGATVALRYTYVRSYVRTYSCAWVSPYVCTYVQASVRMHAGGS